MKIQEKIWTVIDGEGRPVNLEKEKAIAVLNNGENRGAKLSDVFVEHELDDNEIVGFSLLQYFTLDENGSLADKEGNTISLLLADKNIPLKFKKYDKQDLGVKAIALEDKFIPLSYIIAFSESLIGIKDPLALFTNLDEYEKKAILEHWIKKETETESKIQTENEKKRLEAEAETARISLEAENEKKRLEAEAEADRLKKEEDRLYNEKKEKESIAAKYLYETKDYLKAQNFFDTLGGKEYVNGTYHFFYVPITEEEKNQPEPILLIKRGADWWQEVEEGEVIKETDKSVVYQFKDGEKDKLIVIDFEKGDIIVRNVKK